VSNIINLRPNHADVDEILEDAKGMYKEAFVLGWDKDNYLVCRGSMTMDNKEIIFMIESFKAALLASQYEETN
tara:strand:- start:348 stop:566 length:219 start_codon:yes stop_codon:yes gene_type:complete